MTCFPLVPHARRRAGFLILFFSLAILAVPVMRSASAAPQPQAAYEAEMRAYIANQMQAYKIPGLALAVVRGGEVEFLEGFGDADSTGRPVTPDTPFLLASVSKGITALAVMQLVEAGRLGLDDPVREHVPWFEVEGGRGGGITVAQLLYQTSGLTELAGREANLRPDGPDALEEAVRAIAAEELAFAPGEGWENSNLNYDVLGLLVQEVSGQPYGDYIDTNIFAPLEMDNSFASLEEARSGGAAGSFYPFFGFPLAFDGLMPYSRATLPSAGLWSTAADMSRYLVALLDGGDSGPISPAGLEALHTPGHMFDEKQGYAMGWTVNHNFVPPEFLAGTGREEYAGMTILFHEGDGLGYKAMAFLIPEIEYGSILLMNTND
ncbi:MAG TPA: serine hydrolase domain-containing protein, partial [Anaerolineales bacterium]|nr:serine hydrolase domain-containing protein [Anaerolineales bacterium]